MLLGHDFFADCELTDNDEAEDNGAANANVNAPIGVKRFALARHKNMSDFGASRLHIHAVWVRNFLQALVGLFNIAQAIKSSTRFISTPSTVLPTRRARLASNASHVILMVRVGTQIDIVFVLQRMLHVELSSCCKC